MFFWNGNISAVYLLDFMLMLNYDSKNFTLIFLIFLTSFSRFASLCTVIESFVVSKCDHYYPVYLFISLALKKKALGSLSISNNHNLLIWEAVSHYDLTLFNFWVFLLFEVQYMQQMNLSEILLKGKGKRFIKKKINVRILLTVTFNSLGIFD